MKQVLWDALKMQLRAELAALGRVVFVIINQLVCDPA